MCRADCKPSSLTEAEDKNDNLAENLFNILAEGMDEMIVDTRVIFPLYH